MSKKLFKEFNTVSAKEWKQKIQSELKGKDYNNLLTQTAENIIVKPFYHQEDLPKYLAPNADRNWLIAEQIDLESNKFNPDLVLKTVDKGTQVLVFKTENLFTADIIELIRKVADKGAFIFIQIDAGKAILDKLTDQLAGIKNVKTAVDPIYYLCKKGFYPDKNKQVDEAVELQVKDKGILFVNADLYHNAGADATQEIAYTAAHLNEYLNFLVERDQLSSVKEVRLKVALGSRYFIEIAKLKALRTLVQSLLQEYGIQPKIYIQSTNAHRNKTVYDYNLNMIRSTAESMAGILGGADEIINLPYDYLFHYPNEFGQRIARNQLLMLREESHFDKVKNPTEGSYFIEKITEQLADEALSLLKSIEKSGGFLKQLREGKIQQKIKEKAQKEQDKFDNKEITLVGINNYIDDEGHIKDQLDFYPFPKARHEQTQIKPIIAKRLSESIEKEWLNKEDQKS